ncbi:exodeoxyribonuclease DIN7 [Sugiyamaella lignohabitans]|uniref:Exodeoxyribonuclease DIN7 n=1 Tax=Sugiyamaella lignohabitans TaxID=796027 RepID=A0A167FLR7_9ASCO|nr:exodeoxyribonuclease DIN7 [Sugiyamaella lignohabitans]ANB15459.1 exodeoxyribonuclease DIN7 [Sugiyamaella lignohabitans]
MVIEVLKRRNISYVVAPYEADAQLVYLEMNGYIQAIISEDSDLLVFGAQCMLTKMDNVGKCIEVRRDKFHTCQDLNLADFNDENLRVMAILSGCDYSPGISGIGPVKAYNLIRKYREFHRVSLRVTDIMLF